MVLLSSVRFQCGRCFVATIANCTTTARIKSIFKMLNDLLLHKNGLSLFLVVLCCEGVDFVGFTSA